MALALPKPQAIVFDWDNTLVDTWAVIHKSLEHTFSHFELAPWSLAEVRQNVRASAREAFPQLFGEDAEEAIAVFYKHFEANHLEALAPLEGAEGLLKKAEEQAILQAIVSNKTGRYLRKEVEHLGWHDYFSAVVGATDAEKDKPAPDPVLLALKESGLGLDRSIWFVGDTDIDMACAHACGMTAILLHHEGDLPRHFKSEAPHACIKGFQELENLLT